MLKERLQLTLNGSLQEQIVFMKEKSITYEQVEQNFETIRLGVKQRTIEKDIDKCYITIIYKPQPSPPLYAILTNHEIVYLFNHKFGIRKAGNPNQTFLAQDCQVKINLRLEYKLPLLLHIKMKYSYNFQCVFMMLANGQIAIFTDEFYLIGCVDVVCCDPQNSIKYCLDFEYYEKQAFRSARKIKNGFFAFLFSDNFEIHEVQILTNHKLSKFKPSYKVSIVQISKNIVDNHIKHPLNLQLFTFFRSHHFTKFSQKMNNCVYLAVNSLKEVNFFLINKDSMNVYQTIKVGKTHLNGAHVMDIEISPSNKRFFFGLNNGIIKAVSFKQQAFNQLVYTTKISQSSIMKIYLRSLQKMLVYSKDGGLSILNLLTLSIQQKFKLGDSVYFFFINEFHFLSVGNKSHSSYNNNQLQLKQSDFSRLLILNEFNFKYQKVFQYNSQIISFKLEQKSEVIQLSDNSLLINQHIGNKIEVMQTYLPPRSVSVRCIHQNPFTKMEQYWILTQKSQIYKYCVSLNKQVNVTDVIQLCRFLDRNETQHRYSVSYFCFLTKTVPMEYDSETTEKQHTKNLQTNQQLKPICLGTTTGQILITSINSILNIVCRMRSLSTTITNIIEVHPILDSSPLKGLLVYDSKKCQKVIIVELGESQHPAEHFRLTSRGANFQAIAPDLFITINLATFCTFYAKQQEKVCFLYREEHYNPGLIQNSKITAISRCFSQNNQYIVVGFSMGQMLIYRLSRNINQTTYISLSLMYLIQNSKEQPIQFVRYDGHKIYFNLGSFLILNQLPEIELKSYNNINQNYKLNKHKEGRQFNFPQKAEHAKKQTAQSVKFIEQQKQIKLPKLKGNKNKSNRSSSMGLIKNDKSFNVKPDLMFHFPDIQLYRSLIKKNFVE